MDVYGPIKRTTESTISWLVQTALDQGCEVQFLADCTPGVSNHPQQATGRLKGKARKQAKATTKKPAPEKSPTRIVSGSELLRLSSLLGAQNEVLVVPTRVSKAMRRACLGRKYFASNFAREQPGNAGNAPHAHFADVLSKVLMPVMCDKSTSGGYKVWI